MVVDCRLDWLNVYVYICGNQAQGLLRRYSKMDNDMFNRRVFR
jgi:hypothetical protein